MEPRKILLVHHDGLASLVGLISMVDLSLRNPPDMKGCGGCVVKRMDHFLAASILSKKALKFSVSCVSMFDTDLTH